MPNAKVLSEKKLIVEELTGKLKKKSGVFVDYSGISVNEDTELRVKMREASVDYTVVKNTLMRFAIKNVGFEDLDPIFHGTTSLAVSNDDPIAPARIVKEYADKYTNYFEIKGGFMDGKTLTVDEVKAIAGIPPLPILQAQLLGTMLAPITSLAIVLKAIAENGGKSADKADEAPSDAAAPVAEAKAEAPAEPAEEAPVAAKPEIPAEPAEEAKAEAVAEAPAEAAAEAPAEAAAEAVAEAPAEAAAEAVVEAPAEAAAEAVAEAPAEAAAEAAEEAPAKAAPAKKAAKKPAEAETAPESPDEDASETPVEAKAKKTAKKPAKKATEPEEAETEKQPEE